MLNVRLIGRQHHFWNSEDGKCKLERSRCRGSEIDGPYLVKLKVARHYESACIYCHLAFHFTRVFH